jgi:hypothetical protein
LIHTEILTGIIIYNSLKLLGFILFIGLYGIFQMSREAIERPLEVCADFFPELPDDIVTPGRRLYGRKYGIHIPVWN